MCLAVPGKIVDIYERDGLKMAKVDFGGIFRETCLEYEPEEKVVETGQGAMARVYWGTRRMTKTPAGKKVVSLNSQEC